VSIREAQKSQALLAGFTAKRSTSEAVLHGGSRPVTLANTDSRPTTACGKRSVPRHSALRPSSAIPKRAASSAQATLSLAHAKPTAVEQRRADRLAALESIQDLLHGPTPAEHTLSTAALGSTWRNRSSRLSAHADSQPAGDLSGSACSSISTRSSESSTASVESARQGEDALQTRPQLFNHTEQQYLKRYLRRGSTHMHAVERVHAAMQEVWSVQMRVLLTLSLCKRTCMLSTVTS
jgi:hypothetical protein